MVRSQSNLQALWMCSSCLRAQAQYRAFEPLSARSLQPWQRRSFSTATITQDQHQHEHNANQPRKDGDKAQGTNPGAMSRRLLEMAEETASSGSKSDSKNISEAGFSDELKQQLEDRIAQNIFKLENQQALSQANAPSFAGRGTRDNANAKVWTGSESTEDAALRMLDDSHKRLRVPARKPSLSPIAPRPKQRKISVADRLANARDKTSIYAQQQENMSEEERAKFKQELKDRFSSGARPMPTTLQGLTSLANERIEDAIARGQFKNIQRGKGVNIERDYTASSPFLDTTEYFMNKIIQKQEIVPPWIEKQQELMKMVNTFRQRLRSDWRRHAARSISSKGGSLEDQVKRAKAFALAEERHNPRPLRSESMSRIDSTGALTSVTVEERIAAGVAPDPIEDPVEIKVTETVANPVAPVSSSVEAEIDSLSEQTMVMSTSSPAAELTKSNLVSSDTTQEPVSRPSNNVAPMAYPFRDPEWERVERAYHELAVREINDHARSYNLMAPKIAQKPYYHLTRELNRCYADVAPTLPDEILNRSKKGPVRIQIAMHREGSLMDKFQGSGHVAKVRDEPGERGYGFKEFWKDLFSKDTKKSTV